MNNREKYSRTFLKSPFWVALKKAALERDGNECVNCGATEKLHVHHRIYRNSWYETKLEDLETLCNTCHRLEHHLAVRFPIDDLYLNIKTFIGQEKRPPKEMWAELKSEPKCDYITEMLAELIVFYCQSVLRKDWNFCISVRDSILSRCEKYKHLAKNSEWKNQIAQQLKSCRIAAEGLPEPKL